ncbi:MAG: GH92 family glycosyl hydrolase [Cyclobacteriaceae bacterium]|nr:GH92 family glycosyl hydrolase [Cyclobacteriaceae bacterium]MCH8516340.1 GH92 family glycosyl hydrolase [Cyclobacteriaceae bacterium]
MAQVKMSLMALVVLFWSCDSKPNRSEYEAEKLTIVDVFIGTGGHGHTYPGATWPFGMVQLSPDNGTEGWDWSSGYHYSDSVIAGFSHTHLSGTGIGDYADISFMPFDRQRENLPSPAPFLHENEIAHPGYYSVRLDNQIQAELTTGKRVGIHRYTFPQDTEWAISVDLGFNINWDKPTETYLETPEAGVLQGYRYSTGWAKDQRVYFYAKFNEAFSSADLWQAGEPLKFDSVAKGDSLQVVLSGFQQEVNELQVIVGLSSVSIENAKLNLDAEFQGFDFDGYKEKANKAWENEFTRIQFEGITPQIDTIFYTALYHSLVAPNLHADVDGRFKGADGKIHETKERDRYTVFSLWDTFRALHPLYTLIHKEKNLDFLYSMLAFYEEYGLLPVWDLSANETNTMTGYHAIPIIADAILKGQLNEDVEVFYEAMLASAAQDIRGTDLYREYGYIPADLHGWSVTKTLEYAFDDWCISQVAKKLGDESNFQKFAHRSQNYRNLFHPESGFMRAKNSNGDWVEPFDPFYSEHGFEGMYVEGTAWQHTWFVPHDVKGLIDLYGGQDEFIQMLDSTFEVSSKMRGENVSADISGMIGQYAHGNEPSHHIPYMFAQAARPDRTQYRVRQIMDSLYTTGPNGLPGNEDCGQMSAWYVLSAIGIYPVNPASGIYIIGSPICKEAEVKLSNGNVLQIIARNNSKDRSYIKEVKWNGEILTDFQISHQQISKGGVLEFTMSEKPVLKDSSID